MGEDGLLLPSHRVSGGGSGSLPQGVVGAIRGVGEGVLVCEQVHAHVCAVCIVPFCSRLLKGTFACYTFEVGHRLHVVEGCPGGDMARCGSLQACGGVGDPVLLGSVTDAPFSRLFSKSLSLDMIEVARDRGIVHMIDTRARTSLDRT